MGAAMIAASAPRPRPLLLAAAAALAALVPGLASGARRGELYVEVYGGKSFTLPSDLRLRQDERGTDVAFRKVAYADQSLRSPPYYGYRITYFPRERSAVGVGLEFVHLKAIADASRTYRAQGRLRGAPIDADARLADTVQSFEVSHGMNLLTFNVQARAPLRHAAPYAGLGVGIGIPHAESVVEGRGGPSRYALSREPVFQAHAGLRGRPWGDAVAFGEYKFSRARLDAPVAGGRILTTFKTHHALFGAGYRFGP